MRIPHKIKKNKIIKNKKGALSGIISSIGNLIQSIFRTLPKPILFILFLTILLLLGQLIPTIFQAFGIFCNSAEQPVNTGLNPFSNIALMMDKPDPDTLNQEVIKLNKVLFLSYNKHTDCSIRLDSGTIIFPDGTKINITEPTWFYDGAYCTDCLEVTIENPPVGLLTGVSKEALENGICYGDVYPTPEEEKGWYKRQACSHKGGEECEPPIGYYWDAELNLYICQDESCSEKTSGEDWDNKLTEKGATPIYPEKEKTGTGYTSFISIKCRDLKPRLAIYNIEIFDYKIWLLIMLITIGIWALKNFTT